MKIVLVYESMYGNTKTIAEAVAEGLRESGELTFGTVDEITPDEVRDAALVVAGGPTHAHGMARANAHADVVKMDRHHKYGPVLPGTDVLRTWLDRLPESDAKGAAFDTRFNKPAWITGSAAKKIASRLDRKGYPIVAAESFLVSGMDGPLVDGERDRAVAWGRYLAAQVRTPVGASTAES